MPQDLVVEAALLFFNGLLFVLTQYLHVAVCHGLWRRARLDYLQLLLALRVVVGGKRRVRYFDIRLTVGYFVLGLRRCLGLFFLAFFPDLLVFPEVVVRHSTLDVGPVPGEVVGHGHVAIPLDVLNYGEVLVLAEEALLLDVLEYPCEEQVVGLPHDGADLPVLVGILLLEFEEELFH